MLQTLLKRLLITLPALWLLVTLVFLFSRLLPGASGASQILQENEGFYSKGSLEGRQIAYQNYLKRTGQDLPLFYFAVSPIHQPDSIRLIYPEAEHTFVKRLLWTYGDTDAVLGYYTSVKVYAQNSTNPEFTEMLFSTISPEEIEGLTRKIAATQHSSESETHVAILVTQANNLLQAQNSFNYLIPTFEWHGADNQYHHWLINVLKGNLGTSYRDQQPVSQVLWRAISTSFWLILISVVLAFALAMELSILFIKNKWKWLKETVFPLFFVFDSIPLFLLALLLLILFASPTFLQWFPVFGLGYFDPTDAWYNRFMIQLPYLVLPTICLVLANLPYLTSLIYRSMEQETNEDYVRTAKAKGLAEHNIIRKHIFRNSLLPIITILAEALPALVAGTIVIETIFAIPGMGSLLVQAVLARDYPVIVATVLVVALFRAVIYVLADIAYVVADPRLKASKA